MRRVLQSYLATHRGFRTRRKRKDERVAGGQRQPHRDQNRENNAGVGETNASSTHHSSSKKKSQFQNSIVGRGCAEFSISAVRASAFWQKPVPILLGTESVAVFV